jgi:hypothetical protein
MTHRFRPIAVLCAVVFTAAASAAPPLAVELKVEVTGYDTSAKPYIVSVEVTITNRSESKVQRCEVDVSYLDDAGKPVMVKKHSLESLELAPGAETLAGFEDSDPPKTWNKTVSAVAKCR